MVGSGHVDKGAIYSIAGDSKWASSQGFEVCSPPTFLVSDKSTLGPEVLDHRHMDMSMTMQMRWRC